MAAHARSLADRAPVPGRHHRVLRPGRGLRAADPPLAAHAGGDLVGSETYNKLFTMHGVAMVFFFLIPSVPAVLGNFLVPMMIGAKDLAFPRINLLSWYIYMLGGAFTLTAVISGGVDTGWTFYTPYSTAASNSHVILTGLGVFISGFSSILTGLNFIVTIHTMRAPGMTWDRVPLFIWAHYATALIMILGNVEFLLHLRSASPHPDFDLSRAITRCLPDDTALGSA